MEKFSIFFRDSNDTTDFSNWAYTHTGTNYSSDEGYLKIEIN
jgi:hypothetical protein